LISKNRLKRQFSQIISTQRSAVINLDNRTVNTPCESKHGSNTMNEVAFLERVKLINGFNSMIIDRVQAGWQPYFVTFMFRHISGGMSKRTAIMTSEVCRVYSQLLTRIIRNPNAPSYQQLLPYLMASPDLPVPKRGLKASLRDLTINGGLHFHGVLILPPEDRCRLGRHLLAHLHEKESLYCPPDFPLLQIDARSMSTPMLADYVLKQIKRGNVAYDDLLILPRSRSEVR
jgi:hypothetical protein